MEIVLFTGVGIALYLICDQLLLLLEKMHGEPIPNRNIVFFVLILTLSLSSFSLMRTFLFNDEGPQNNNQEQHPADSGDQSTQTH